jgi:hypothetical protein
MALTKTLAVVLNTCVKEADIVLGTGSTNRHETSDAIVYINDSHRAMMTLLTTRGFDFYLTETALAALPTSRADTNEQYSLVDWPSGSTLIKRVDVYAPKSQGTVSAATFTAGKIALAPFSSNGTYKITYQPEWANITDTTHLFMYPDETCAQWVVWDFVIKVSARDNNAKKRFEIANQRQAKCEAQIGHFVPNIVQTGPMTVTRSPDYRR